MCNGDTQTKEQIARCNILSVTLFTVVLSVVMLNAFVVNVVVPIGERGNILEKAIVIILNDLTIRSDEH